MKSVFYCILVAILMISCSGEKEKLQADLAVAQQEATDAKIAQKFALDDLKSLQEKYDALLLQQTESDTTEEFLYEEEPEEEVVKFTHDYLGELDGMDLYVITIEGRNYILANGNGTSITQQ